MLGAIIQSVILIGIIAWLSDGDFSDYQFIDYVFAGSIALVTLILSSGVVIGLTPAIGGLAAGILAIAIGALVVGAAITYLSLIHI